MGGKSGGPLTSWIREFTTLVFVQTVQAFIYAIIMILIMSTMEQTSAITGDDYNSALGLMCVFALTSLFKVEEMVRKIFGLGGTKADHQGAVKSIAKTAFALQIGKRVMDNGKKFAGGVKKVADSNKNAKKSRQRLQEDRADLGLGNGSRRAGSSAGGANSSSSSSASLDTSSNTSLTAGGTNTTSVDTSNMTDEQILNSNAIDPRTKQKLRAAIRAAEEDAKKLKDQRNEGLKDIAKSFAESGGAVLGGTAGAILGGADGNLEEAIQGMVSGMGLGDAAGEFAVNTADSLGKFTRNRVDGINKFVKEVENEINDADGRLKVAKATIRNIQNRSGQLGKYDNDIKSLKDDFKNAYGKSVDDT